MRRFIIRSFASSIFVACALSGATHAQDGSSLSMGIGLDQSSGTYGTTTTTDVTSTTVYALYERGDWWLRLAVPYLQVTGDGSVVVSSGHGGRRSMSGTMTSATRTTQSGLGDVVAMASYNLVSSEGGGSGLDLAGRIKFGTASGTMGSGKNDYAAQLTAYSSIGDFSPSLMLGYEVLGSSTDLPLNNIAYGTVGASYAITDKTDIGADYRYAQRAAATGSEQREASLYTGIQIGRDTYLRAYVMKGLADGSPDSSYGLSVSSGF